jgi:hypothetical protein
MCIDKFCSLLQLAELKIEQLIRLIFVLLKTLHLELVVLL